MPNFDDEVLDEEVDFEDEEFEPPEEEDGLEELEVDERGHVRLRSSRRRRYSDGDGFEEFDE